MAAAEKELSSPNVHSLASLQIGLDDLKGRLEASIKARMERIEGLVGADFKKSHINELMSRGIACSIRKD